MRTSMQQPPFGGSNLAHSEMLANCDEPLKTQEMYRACHEHGLPELLDVVATGAQMFHNENVGFCWG